MGAHGGVLQEEPRIAQGPRSLRELFVTFARIGVSGFGGVNFWMRRVLVQQKGWLTDQEYLEGFAMGQLVPGPNVYNLTVMIGHRFGGWRGALLAVAGLIGPPLVIVLSLGALYQSFGGTPIVQRALGGMGAVAAGLILANGVSLAAALPRRARPWVLLLAAFFGMGVMRWPFIYVMGALGPLAIALAWMRPEA
ncbi:MAG TPA: chromate transporter [Burkholderiales bacterium]|nr:chromate transporter [Burkholderiales bacterium]